MSVPDHSGFGPLLWATAFGKVDVVKLLLGYVDYRGISSNNHEAGVQENLSEMLEPLHAAACVGAEEVCLSLLDAGAKVPELSCVLCFNLFSHCHCGALLALCRWVWSIWLV